MRSAGAIKRRVWVGLAAAAVGAGTWAWWMHLQGMEPAVPSRAAQPFVQLAASGSTHGSSLLLERAELLDPTPLFFPTEWNYGQRPLNESRLRQPGQFFESFEPKLTVPEQGRSPFGLEAVHAPERLADVLSQGNEAPLAGMGQVDLRTSTLPVRAAFVEVVRIGDKESIISQSLTGIQPPRSDYSPMEFLVIVGPGGLIGDPILTSGSGWDEVDNFFRVYLARSYHLGERLGPGRYRVVVGA
jgi:hypothetical protein